jgi:hypothetical protein
MKDLLAGRFTSIIRTASKLSEREQPTVTIETVDSNIFVKSVNGQTVVFKTPCAE